VFGAERTCFPCSTTRGRPGPHDAALSSSTIRRRPTPTARRRACNAKSIDISLDHGHRFRSDRHLQACEFDYSAPRPAKFCAPRFQSDPGELQSRHDMTDPATADVTYVEPLDAHVLTDIIDAEPPTRCSQPRGGQTRSSCRRLELVDAVVTNRFGVEVMAAHGGRDRAPSAGEGENRPCWENLSQVGDGRHRSAVPNRDSRAAWTRPLTRRVGHRLAP